eukprot:COSAG02_NODE_3004_length_7571_cov_65.586188_3_plen_57_part_00
MSELQVDVECVEEASLLGVFIILVVMVLIPVRAPRPRPRLGALWLACSHANPTAIM